MIGFPHRSQPAIASDRHGPGQWQDLKRDWQRWSRAERLAVEFAFGLALICGAVALASVSIL